MAAYGYALDDHVPQTLADAATAGCDIRVLLLDPDYAGAADVDQGEGNPLGTLAPRIRAALARFSDIRTRYAPGMTLRVYAANPTVSLVRVDERMVVTPYLRFFVGSNSPTFELHSGAVGAVFSRYVRHFETTWNLAKDWDG
jgi:hypothetical protein